MKSEQSKTATAETQQYLRHLKRRPLHASARLGLMAAHSCEMETQRDILRREVEVAKDDHLKACQTIAQMHEAAMGEVCGPKRGVVEDILDLRIERDALRREVEEFKNNNRYHRGHSAGFQEAKEKYEAEAATERASHYETHGKLNALFVENTNLRAENAALKAKYETPAPNEQVQAALAQADLSARVAHLHGWPTSDLSILATAYRQSQARVKELYGALNFKPDAPHEIVLHDAKRLRPEMVKARERVRDIEGSVDYWLNDEAILENGGALAKIWKKLKETERLLTIALAQLETEKTARKDMDRACANWHDEMEKAQARVKELEDQFQAFPWPSDAEIEARPWREFDRDEYTNTAANDKHWRFISRTEGNSFITGMKGNGDLLPRYFTKLTRAELAQSRREAKGEPATKNTP